MNAEGEKPTVHRASPRHTLRLKKLSAEIVRAEMKRRGIGLGGTVNALVTEWHLLSRISRAADWRREMREDLNFIRAAVAAAGRQDLLRQADDAAARITGRLVLVGAL